MNEDFQTTEEITKEKENKNGGNKLPLILSIIGLAGVVILFCLYFCCGNSCQNTDKEVAANTTVPSISAGEIDIKIAYVDTEYLLSSYELAQEIQKDLQNIQIQKEQQFQRMVNNLQTDFENYLQTGASLSLAQQQEKEADLQRREAQLGQRQEQLMAELADFRMEKYQILEDSIVNYIARFNGIHNYTLILEKTGVNGVLYGDQSLNITDQVLDGLNGEYRKSRNLK